MLEERESMDSCLKERKVALREIEARGLPSSIEKMVASKKRNRKKKLKTRKKEKICKKNRVLEILEDDDDDDIDGGFRGN